MWPRQRLSLPQITDEISVQYNGLVPCITISTRSLVSYVVMIQSSLILKSTLSPTATISTSDTFCLNMAEYYCVNLVCISLLDLYRVCVSIHMIFVIIANLKLCSFYKMIILFYVPSFQEIFQVSRTICLSIFYEQISSVVGNL